MDTEGYDEDPERHHRCRNESYADSRDAHRVGMRRTLLTRPQREVEMHMQVHVQMNVPLPWFTVPLLTRFKTLASWFIT